MSVKLGDYSFSIEIAGPDYYPYYFADTYGAVSPYPLAQVLGEGVEVKDDGNGCYLTEAWYKKGAKSTPETPVYEKSEHLKTARYDLKSYPYSGPYVIENYDDSTKQTILKINKEYAGNFEGQKPSITTVVYTKVVEETQVDKFVNGEVDVRFCRHRWRADQERAQGCVRERRQICRAALSARRLRQGAV